MGTTEGKTPGAQAPQKYPFVGPSYKKWGEQPGYLYDPYLDKYRPDPKVREQLAKDQGTYVEPPKQPGLSDLVLPIAGIGAATTIGQSAGSSLIGAGGGSGGGLLSGAADLVGLGGSGAVASASPAGVTGIGPVASGFGGVPGGGMYAEMVGGQSGGGLMAGGEMANAAGGGSNAAAGLGSAGGYMPIAGPAMVAATPIIGKMIANKFFPSTPSRPFDLKEFQESNKLASAFPGFDKASPEVQAKVAEALRGKSNKDTAQVTGSMSLYSRGNAKEQKPYEYYAAGLGGREKLFNMNNPYAESKGWGGASMGAEVDNRINSMTARQQLEALKGKISKEAYDREDARLKKVEGLLAGADPAAGQLPIAPATPSQRENIDPGRIPGRAPKRPSSGSMNQTLKRK